jgi:formylglycine-generating enzyme required for sulfatase activity
MAGNVWEWTGDFYTAGYGKPATDLRVVRGGTWFGYDRADVRSSLRFRIYATARDYGVGFRCARSL